MRRALGARCGEQVFGPAPPIGEVSTLFVAARGHSDDMARRGYFSHLSPEGHMPSDRAVRAGHASGSVGENLAAGTATPEAAVELWMGSTGHCGNIVNPSYRTTGVGDASGGRHAHLWTQKFGH